MQRRQKTKLLKRQSLQNAKSPKSREIKICKKKFQTFQTISACESYNFENQRILKIKEFWEYKNFEKLRILKIWI